MRILVLDDNDDQREIIGRILERYGYSVHMAARADDAILLGRDGFLPDLLIADIGLSGALDGYDVALYWRSKMPRLPVVYLSARAEVDLARRMPGSIYLKKPARSDVLIDAIERLTGDSELSRRAPRGQ